MVGTSKILTVSYGTFSCTLEGFDDPFAAMRTVAEYFRDLASEDRYFGAEPPQLDAEALRAIAQDGAPRQVTAQVGEAGVTLRQLPDAAAGAEDEAEAGAQPKPRRRDRAAVKAAVKARVLAEDEEEEAAESVAAKMDRIRAAVSRSRVEGYAEDEEAEAMFATAPIAAAFADLADAAERSRDAAAEEEEAEAPQVEVAEAEAEPAEPEAGPAAGAEPAPEADVAGIEEPEAHEAEIAAPDTAAAPEPEVAEAAEPFEAEAAEIAAPEAEEPAAELAGDVEEEAEDGFAAILSVEVEETVELVLSADAPEQSLELLAAAISGARVEADAEAEEAPEGEADAGQAAFADEALEWAAVGNDDAGLPEEEEEVEAADLRDLAALDGAFDDEELIDDRFEDGEPADDRFGDEEPVERVTGDADLAGGDAPGVGVEDAGGDEDDADSFPEARFDVEEDDGPDAAAADVAAPPAPAEPAEEAAEQPAAAEAGDPAVADLLERLRKAVQRAQAARDAAAATAATEAEYAEAEIVAPGEMPEAGNSPPPRLVRARVVKMKRRDVEADAPDVLAAAVAAFAADVEAEEAGESDEARAEPLRDEDFDPFDAADEAAESFAAEVAAEESMAAEDEMAEEFAAGEEAAEDVAGGAGWVEVAAEDEMAEAFAADDEPAETLAPTDGMDLLPDRNGAQTQGEHSSLSPEDEAELMAELAEVEAEADPRQRGRAAFEGPRGAPTSVTRILRETETQLDDSEGSRRRSTIAHLKAAVAATRAEGLEGRDDGDDTDLEAYREDLDRMVRPKQQPEGGSGGGQRRLAPLMLVSEQRIDLPQGEAARADAGPRRVTAGNLALAEEQADEALFGDGEAEDDELLFADGTTFADYAGRMGATDLPDLMEAAAAYAAFVEGRPHFTRPQLMKQVADLGEAGFSREDGLRSFGTLLRQGRIEKLKRGQYTISSNSRFRPENLQPRA